MIRLRQTGGAHDGRVLEFNEGPVRMGRMPDSEVPLDPFKDRNVSGRHAEIVSQGSHWVVVDCGSRNGTFVNGQRIGQQPVSSGDTIQLGEDGAVFTVELAPSEVVGTVDPVGLSLEPGSSPEPGRWAPTPFAPPGAATTPTTPQQWGAPQPSAPPSQESHGQPEQTPQFTPDPRPEPTMGELAKVVSSDEAPTALKVGVALLAVLFGLVTMVVVVAAVTRDPVPDASRVAAANEQALLQIVGHIGGRDAPFCTGFAVRPSLLATSARCVLEIEHRQHGGAFVEVVRGTQRYRVSRLWRHPEFDSAFGVADVGLVQVDRAFPLVVNLGRAGDEHLVALGFSQPGLVATPVDVDVDVDVIRYATVLPAGAPLLDASGAVVGVHSGAPGGEGGPGQGIVVEELESLLAGLPE